MILFYTLLDCVIFVIAVVLKSNECVCRVSYSRLIIKKLGCGLNVFNVKSAEPLVKQDPKMSCNLWTAIILWWKKNKPTAATPITTMFISV